MKTTIDISPKILNWVFENIKADSVPPKVLENLELWESGEKSPTFSQLQKVSRVTRIPFGYFFLKTPPKEDLPLVKYRTVQSIELEKPSRELVDIIYDMEDVQDWLRDYLISQDAEPLKFVGSLKNEKNIGVFASTVRKLLHIPENWYQKFKTTNDFFNFVRKAISDLGAPVMVSSIVENNNRRKLDLKEFRAFAISDPYAPLIFINSNDSANGKLFSLLHEFCHLCLGQNSLFNQTDEADEMVREIEKLCNAVAAEIILPQTGFAKEWNSMAALNDPEKIIDILSNHFKCGITVVARKARDNGFIGSNLYQKTAKLAISRYNENLQKKKESGRRSGGNYYRTAQSRIDPRFLKLLISSVNEGKTLYTDAFRLTNTNYSTFMNLAERIEGSYK